MCLQNISLYLVFPFYSVVEQLKTAVSGPDLMSMYLLFYIFLYQFLERGSYLPSSPTLDYLILPAAAMQNLGAMDRHLC